MLRAAWLACRRRRRAAFRVRPRRTRPSTRISASSRPLSSKVARSLAAERQKSCARQSFCSPAKRQFARPARRESKRNPSGDGRRSTGDARRLRRAVGVLLIFYTSFASRAAHFSIHSTRLGSTWMLSWFAFAPCTSRPAASRALFEREEIEFATNCRRPVN